MDSGAVNQQGQGDVVSRANTMADMLTAGDRIRYGDDAALLRELAEEIARLRTLLSSSRGEQGWRTIDSAPKDGSDILAWSPGLMIGAMVLYWADGYWREKANCMGLKADITHWMPLPSAPGSVPTSPTLAETLEALLKRSDDFRELFLNDQSEPPSLTLEVDPNDLADLYDGLFLASMDARLALQGAVPTSLAGQVPDGYASHRIAELEQGLRRVLDHDLSSPRFHHDGNLSLVIESMRACALAALQPTAGGDAPTSATVNQIMDALAVEVPEQWFAFADCKTECGFEWNFADGSKLWLDFTRDGVMSVLWRKGKHSQPQTLVLQRSDALSTERARVITRSALGQQDTGGADHG